MKTKWGILSTAKIGTDKVIPAIQNAPDCEVIAIASRDLLNAEKAAFTLGISRSYGSYQELLDDPEIEIIYNPLPNHLHVEWTIKAVQCGKHVLCEKPIGLNALEAIRLREAREKHPEIKVMEAFMYKFHPQWKKTKSLIEKNEIGEVRNVQSYFSYYNVNPQNIRNIADVGGGALMDIGCYCISFARFIFESEPQKVTGIIVRDPEFKTDIQTSALMDFGNGRTSQFVCSTQQMPYQRVQILGTEGRIEVEVPVNAMPDRKAKITLFKKEISEVILFDPIDQYTEQAIAFASSVSGNSDDHNDLDDALNNMKVIDAIFQSEKTNNWVEINDR